MATRARKSPYEGPECPRCLRLLAPEQMRSGVVVCPTCNRGFEATMFTAPQRRMRVIEEVAGSGPEGANACANHERNSAVTSCQRCGLFICSLCDMNIGAGSYCPTCFDLLRTEGSLKEAATRTRDYASMARVSAFVGFLFMFMFLGLPFGILTLVYARKALKQARAEHRSTAGIRVTSIFGLLETIGGAASIVFLILAVTGGLK